MTRLAEISTSSIVADLDDDGTREVVGIVADDELPGLASVQAWWVDTAGSVTPSNQVRLRRSATFDDRVAIGNGIRIDEQGMTGVRISEPARLFTVRREGREVALASGIGKNPDLTVVPCCFTLWEVTTTETGEIGLQLAVETHLAAYQVVAADMDADGTDELLVSEMHPEDPDFVGLTAVLLKWDGATYRMTRSGSLAGETATFPLFADAGDTDGVPGDDVLVVDAGFFDQGAPISRWTLRQGALDREEGLVAGAGGIAIARVLPLPSGPTIIIGDGEFVREVRWGRDRPVEPLLISPNRGGLPLAVLGSGADLLVVAGDPFGTGMQVFSPADEQWAIVGADLRAGVFATAMESVAVPLATWSYAGIVPGGFPDAQESFVFSGMRLVPTPEEGEPFRLDPMATLPGHAIAGTAGPAAAWTVLSELQPTAFGQSPAVLVVGESAVGAALDLAATASVIQPEVANGQLEPTMSGVAPDPERPSQLIVGSEPFDVIVEAPPGSRVWALRQGRAEEYTVGPDGTLQVRLIDAAGEGPGGSGMLTRGVSLVTPSGHAYLGRWAIRVFRQSPDLGIDDEDSFIDFAPTVRGQTLPGSTMTVNGEAAPVASDGTFAVPVRVGIVPTEIRIVVTDPVGNQTVRLITRVWPLDYRQLPWVAIVVFVLFTVAGLLYVWEPDTRSRRAVPQDEDATFEDIGG